MLDAQNSAKEAGSIKGTSQGGGMSTYGKGGQRDKSGWWYGHLREGRTRFRGTHSVEALDIWGWLPQPRLASNVCDLYSSVQKTMSPMSK